MTLQATTYLVVGLTFAIYIAIAVMARARSTSDFYVAGKGVHPVLNGMATGADWMSAASFISMAGLIAFMGYDACVYLMGWTGGYVLLAMMLAPYLRKFGKFTVPEFIGDRYYSHAARITAVICLIICSITYVIGQMKGIGVAFSRFLEVDFSTGLYCGMGIVFVYAVLGGMKGITYTQIAQYCVLIFAYTVPAVFIAIQLTGNPIPQLALGSHLTEASGSGMYLLAKLNLICTDLGFAEYTAQKWSTMNIFLLTLSLMIGTAGLPHVIIRFFTVPKVRDARFSTGWALVFISLLYTTAPAVGAMARSNLMHTIQIGPVGSPTGNLAYADRPSWFTNWEKTGLLKWVDKNGDGRIQYYNDKNAVFAKKAEGFGWKGNEMVKVDRDIMVLANPEIANLPFLGHCPRCGRRYRGRPFNGRRPLAGHRLLHFTRPVQDHFHEKYQRETGAAHKPHRHGRRDRRGRDTGLAPSRIRSPGGGLGLRSCRLVHLSCIDDGNLLQEGQPSRGHRRDAHRYRLHPPVHLSV